MVRRWAQGEVAEWGRSRAGEGSQSFLFELGGRRTLATGRQRGRCRGPLGDLWLHLHIAGCGWARVCLDASLHVNARDAWPEWATMHAHISLRLAKLRVESRESSATRVSELEEVDFQGSLAVSWSVGEDGPAGISRTCRDSGLAAAHLVWRRGITSLFLCIDCGWSSSPLSSSVDEAKMVSIWVVWTSK